MCRFLFVASLGLTVISVLANAAIEVLPNPGAGLVTFESLFDVVGERTVQAWYSTGLLALAGVGAWITAVRARLAPGDRSWRPWTVVSASLVWVSLDEMVGIHELLNDPNAPAGPGRFAWILVGLPVAIVLAITMVPVLRELPWELSGLLVLSGAVFVGGAVGIEFLSGFFVGTNLIYGSLAHVEELFEMVGVVLFLEALLRLNRVPSLETGRMDWEDILVRRRLPA